MGGQRPGVTLDREVDGQLALRGLRDEVAELGEAGLGGEVVGLAGAAQEPEQTVQLDDRLAAGRFDRAERRRRLVRLAFHHPPGRAGLHAHHADVVGDDVVQLAGDADPLGEHGLAGVLLPLSLAARRPDRPAPLCSRAATG